MFTEDVPGAGTENSRARLWHKTDTARLVPDPSIASDSSRRRKIVEHILPRQNRHAPEELRLHYGLGGAALLIWGWRRRFVAGRYAFLGGRRSPQLELHRTLSARDPWVHRADVEGPA